MRVAYGLVVVTAMAAAIGSEQSWELRGEFVALKSGDPELAVLRLADGRTVEVPIDALGPASQAAARRAAADVAASAPDDANGVTVRGPFGRPVMVPVPESIKNIESDAIHCHSAADAAVVYRLALADTGLAAESRKAAEGRLRAWEGMATKGLVRLGDRWVPPEEARAAAEEAAKVFKHALQLMRLGNADLAEEELRKASRIDPESGRASFVMGLAYAMVARNPAKAADQFWDAARREPDDAAVLVDLGLAEIYARRHANAVVHFRDAAAVATDLQPLLESVAWAVRLAGDAKVNPALARNKMPDKAVDELNALFMKLTQDHGLRPPQGDPQPRFVGPDGRPCTATKLAEVAALFEGAPAVSPLRRSLGFVVAPGHVVCPRRVLAGADGTLAAQVTVTVPGTHDGGLPAEVIAAPEDGQLAILHCPGLDAEPLPLAREMPSTPTIVAVDRAGAGGSAAALKAARGKVVTPADEARKTGWFIHTAVVPRGAGGGPIVDAAGRVVGIVAATPPTDASGNHSGLGIPVEWIVALLAGRVDDLPAPGPETDDIAAVERRGIQSTVVVTSGEPAAAVAGPPGAKP